MVVPGDGTQIFVPFLVYCIKASLKIEHEENGHYCVRLSNDYSTRGSLKVIVYISYYCKSKKMLPTDPCHD